MTTFEYKLMLVMAKDLAVDVPAQDLYDTAKDPSRVRRTLKLMTKRGWVKCTRRVKRTDGPGAPMKYYTLDDKGQEVFQQHEKELQDLRR